MARKRVAIIGAGLSGLSAIKSCLEEGLEPVCFEQHDKIGGVWYFTEEVRPNQGTSVYESLITNSSKEMTSFTDFPFPADCPPFLPYNLVYKYVNDFADHFDLRKHVQFNTTIDKVERSPDYQASGSWNVLTRKTVGDDQSLTKDTFDAVLVCSGFCKEPVMPDIPGSSEYGGTLLHMQQYRNPKMLRGKRVLVIGNANSAGDMATDAGRHASQTYLSVGDGTWLITRLADGGMPRDFLHRRLLTNIMPTFVISRIVKNVCNRTLDHVNFGLQASKDPLQGSPVMVTDELSPLLMSGRVQVRAGVERFTKTGALLKDGTSIQDVDVVICATGYQPRYTFLDESIIPNDPDLYQLFKMVFPVNVPHNNLAFIGCFSTVGAHTPAIELQARWATRVLSGKCALPAKDIMERDIERRKAEITKRYGTPKIKFAAVPYRDELAEQLGVLPSFWKLVWRSPKAAFQCLLGPAFPIQYRLLGPGARPEAWQGTDLAIARTVNSTKTRQVDNRMTASSTGAVLFKFLLFVLVTVPVLFALLGNFIKI